VARLALLVLVVASCRGGSKAKRQGGEAPVVVVNQPVTLDAGHGPSTSDEIEPNDGDDVATPLALGGTVRGKLDPETDVDHYRIDVDKAGALSVMVNAIDADLIVEIEDSSGAIIARSDRGAARTKEGVPNLGVTAGRYTAVVHAAPKKKPKPPKKGRRGAPPAPEPDAPKAPAPAYEITAQLVAPPAGAEHEPDDDRGTANDILPSDTATGYLGWTGDADSWKLSTEALSAKNAVEVDVAGVEGIALELEVEDALGQPLASRKGIRGEPLVAHGIAPSAAPGAPPFMYLVVRGDHSNPETPYQLKVAPSVVQPDTEAEPNDSPDHAFAMDENRTVIHALFDVGDTDCFAIAAAKDPRSIDVAIDTPAELDLGAELFVDGKSVAKTDKPGKGVAEKLSAPLTSNAHAVACVKLGDKAGAQKAAVPYDVHVDESGAP
jgi:hypothetical protein